MLMRQSSLESLLHSGASLIVTPEIARQILSDCRYQNQRPLNEDRALLLAGAMEHGTFRINTQLGFARLGGRLLLVDGQHRLNAVDLSGRPVPFRIEIYDCASEGEVDALYCRFDQPGGQRSQTQISRSLGLHDDDENGLRPATAALLLRATPMLILELRRIPPALRPRQTRDLDFKKEVALQWKPQAIDYQACLDCGLSVRTGRFRSGGVFAVALVTLRYQREKAKLFWSRAIRNDALRTDDPAHALHSYFLSNKKKAAEFDLAEAASHAWNAFFKGRSLTFCKSVGSPIRLLGTPVDGGE